MQIMKLEIWTNYFSMYNYLCNNWSILFRRKVINLNTGVQNNIIFKRKRTFPLFFEKALYRNNETYIWYLHALFFVFVADEAFIYNFKDNQPKTQAV